METLEKEKRFLVNLPLKWYGRFKVLSSDKISYHKTFLRGKRGENAFLQVKIREINCHRRFYQSYQTIMKLENGIVKRNEVALDQDQYNIYLTKRDTTKNKIYKTSYTINFNNSNYIFDVYQDDLLGIAILRKSLSINPVYRSVINNNVLIPPHFDIREDITDNIKYDECNLAIEYKFR